MLIRPGVAFTEELIASVFERFFREARAVIDHFDFQRAALGASHSSRHAGGRVVDRVRDDVRNRSDEGVFVAFDPKRVDAAICRKGELDPRRLCERAAILLDCRGKPACGCPGAVCGGELP